MSRFSYEREAGSDYKIVDNILKRDTAHGLSFDEAESTVEQWNKAEENKKQELNKNA